MIRFTSKDSTAKLPSAFSFSTISSPVGLACVGLFAFVLIATPCASFADGLRGVRIDSNNTADLGTQVSSGPSKEKQQEQMTPKILAAEDPFLAELRQISEEPTPPKRKEPKGVSPAPKPVMESPVFGPIPVVTVDADVFGQYLQTDPDQEIQKRAEKALAEQGLLSKDFNFTAMNSISLERLLTLGNYRLNKNGTPKKTIFALSYDPQNGLHDPELQLETWIQYTAAEVPSREDKDGFVVVWRAKDIERDYSVEVSRYILRTGATPVMIITLKGVNSY